MSTTVLFYPSSFPFPSSGPSKTGMHVTAGCLCSPCYIDYCRQLEDCNVLCKARSSDHRWLKSTRDWLLVSAAGDDPNLVGRRRRLRSLCSVGQKQPTDQDVTVGLPNLKIHPVRVQVLDLTLHIAEFKEVRNAGVVDRVCRLGNMVIYGKLLSDSYPLLSSFLLGYVLSHRGVRSLPSAF